MVRDLGSKNGTFVDLDQLGGHMTRTADAIGVSRQFLHRLVERYGLRATDRR